MEVHHHPHTESLTAGKAGKRFKHYFFEFFMLFLAVFCGFLAENFREHQVEKQRAKGYIFSFYEDLKTDSSRMSYYTDFDDTKLTTLSNLTNCFDLVTKDNEGSSCLLDLIKISAVNRPFKITDRTLNQLANAGGFRLLKKEDADSIIAYQNKFNNFQDFQQTAFQQAQDKVRTSFDEIVNFPANNQMFKPDGNRVGLNFDNKDVTNPILFTHDRALLNKYFNQLLLYYRSTFNHRKILEEIKENQIRLIEFFKKKYHFE